MKSSNGAMKLEASGAQSSLFVAVLILIPQMGMALRKGGFLTTLLESPLDVSY